MSCMSVIPALVPHRESVEDLTVRLPLGHELIHQSDRTRVVRRFKQVNHLVNDNVLKAFTRLSGEIGIQSNGARAVITATPFRLHSLDEESPYSHPQQLLPFLDQWGNRLAQLLAMPFFDDR